MSRRRKKDKVLHHIEKEVAEDTRLLHQIEHELHQLAHHPATIRIEFQGVTMPVTLQVGQSVVATPVETDATGNVVVISNPAGITWSTSDATIATARAIGDGTAEFSALAAGEVTVTVTDPANGLTTTDTITVESVEPPPPPPDVATEIKIEWGEPKAQENDPAA